MSNKGYCKDCMYYSASDGKFHAGAICNKVHKREKISPYNGLRIEDDLRVHLNTNVDGECQYYDEKE